MGKQNVLIQVRETENHVTIALKQPTRRYFDEFMGLKCAPDILNDKLFPNSKEITESMAAWKAAFVHLWKTHKPGDPNVTAIVVADGHTPRTGALFAYRTRWSVYSIDPNMRTDKDWSKIERLKVIKSRCEESTIIISPKVKPVIIAVHSHAQLDAAIKMLQPVTPDQDCHPIPIISLPCCVAQTVNGYRGNIPSDIEYTDWGIWSPERRVKVWYGITPPYGSQPG